MYGGCASVITGRAYMMKPGAIIYAFGVVMLLTVGLK